MVSIPRLATQRATWLRPSWRRTLGLLTLWLLTLGLWPLSALAEVPGVWFLNARLTGSDYVYLAVGGTDQQPPASPSEVKLSWRWVESKMDIPSYPDTDVEVVYRQSSATGKRAQAWSVDAELTGFPILAVGPGRELWLVADVDDAEGLAEASRWSVLLDAVEAAWRQSAPQLDQAERLSALDIGRLGGCVVRSRPLPANLSLTEDAGWRPVTLTSHARPSRRGGYTYVQPNEPPRPDELRDVEVRRFQRWLEKRDPNDCQGEAGYLILRLFPVPEDDIGRLRSDHFLDVHWIDTQAVSMPQLAADPWRPGVRALAPTAPDRWNAAPTFLQPPTRFSPSGIDLCTLAGTAELCARDAELRARLYTWSPQAQNPGLGDLQGTLLEACGERLGGAQPCNEPELWQRQLGNSVLAGFRGDLTLSADPPILSRLNEDGSVSWQWQADPDAAVSTTEALFQLPDGAAVTLRLPDLNPPVAQPGTTTDSPPPPAPGASSPGRREWGVAGFVVALEGDTLYLPGDLEVPLTWALAAAGGSLVLLVVLFVLRQLRRRPNRDATTTMSRLRPDFDDPFPELPASTASSAIRSPESHEDAPPGADARSGGGDAPADDGDAFDTPVASLPPRPPLPELPPAVDTPSHEEGKAATSEPPTLPRFSIDPRPPLPDPAATLNVAEPAVATAAAEGTPASPAPEPESPTPPAADAALVLGRVHRVDEDDLDVTIADLPSARAAAASVRGGIREGGDPGLGNEPGSPPDSSQPATAEQERALRERLRQLERRHREDQQRIDAMADHLRRLEARLEQVVTTPPDVAPSETSAASAAAFATAGEASSADATTKSTTAALVLCRGLGRWIEHVWPMLTQVALETVPASDFEALLGVLPAPAQHEFRAARATLRRFSESTGDPASLQLSTLCEVVEALQYLTEAFPLEQLDPSARKKLRAALSERMPGHGLPASFHELVVDLAGELDVYYHPAPYYKARLGDERYPFLEGHCKVLDLAARAGSALRTEAGTVVRVEPPFFSKDGKRLCGAAWVFE